MDAVADSGGRVTRALRKRIASIDSDSSSRPGTPVQSKLAASTNSPLKTRITRRNSTSGVGTPVKTPGKRVGTVAAIAESVEGAVATPPRRVTRRRSVSSSIEGDNGTPQHFGAKAPNIATLSEKEEDIGRVTRSKSKSPQQPKAEKLPVSESITKGAKRRSLRSLKDNEKENDPEVRKEDSPNIKPSPQKKIDQENKNEMNEENTEKNVEDVTKEPMESTENNIASEEKNPVSVPESLLSETSNDTSSTLPEPEPLIDNCDLKLQVTPSPLQSGEADSTPTNKHLETICKTPSPNKAKSTSPKKQSHDFNAVTPAQNKKATVKIVGFNSQASDDECEKSIYPKTPGTSKSKSFIDVDMDTSFQGDCDESVVSVDDMSVMEIPETQIVDDEVEIITENNAEDNDIITEEMKESSAATTRSPRTPKKAHNEDKSDSIGNLTAKDEECVIKSSPKSPKNSPKELSVEMPNLEKSKTPLPKESATLENNDDGNEQNESLSKSTNDPLKQTDVPKSASPPKELDSLRSPKKSSPCGVTGSEKNKISSVNESLKQSTEPAAEKRKTLSPRKDSSLSMSSQISPEVEIKKEQGNVPSSEEPPATENQKTVSPVKGDNHGESSPPPLKWCNPSVVAKNNTKLDTIANEEQTHSKQNERSIIKSAEKAKKKKKHFLKRDEWKSDEENCSGDESVDDHTEEEHELDEDEEPYRRKHVFHDDEAMVVDDYESGDSMDSEERREILENEIPVDGESIGSHTTDGEDNDHGDEEESENDSFIVSDNDDDEIEEENHLESNGSCTDSDDEDEESECNQREKRKSYKRIKRVEESSSSEEDTVDNVNKVSNEINLNDIAVAEEDKNVLNSTKLSDSALRLQSQGEESEQSNEEEADTVAINQSRKEILRKLNQSDRFNKSVRDLNPDVDISPEVERPIKDNDLKLNEVGDHEDSGSESVHLEVTEGNQSLSAVNQRSYVHKSGDADSDAEMETDPPANESEVEENENKQVNESLMKKEIAITSEEERDENADEDNEDDDDVSDENDKENDGLHKIKSYHNRGLSVSFGHFKSAKKDSLQKRVLQRSFTIGVRIKGGELGTAVIENNTSATPTETCAPSSSTSPGSSNEENDDPALSTEDIHYLENIKHMPLGNPLVRTRRQSLALPTNPDMEICASSLGIAATDKKPKRKSLGILSGNDFNPSQSFVDSLELRKAELSRQASKRKRLSKSFCGTSEGLDNSVIDLDARHLHKRSKLAIDSSFVDSLENLSSNKSTGGGAKMKHHSSTPREKEINKKHKSDDSIIRIQKRCDEILEAANRAKLEAKINYKKSKVKLSKKSKKKLQRQSLSPESKHAKLFAPVTKEFKRKEKLKKTAALTRAVKASADIIMGKQRKPFEHENTKDEKKLSPPKVLAPIAESSPPLAKTKKNKKHPLSEHSSCRNYATSAGNVVETMRTPEKKKKPKIIQLPTGKVCVEPITPIKRSILTCNGMEFRESPATPCDGLGFSIEFSALDTPEFAGAAAHVRDHKRKRNIAEEAAKMKTFPKPQWTQSGPFMEEEIPSARGASHQFARIVRKHHPMGGLQSNINFKQNALMRGDIKRSSTREILQLRERRQFLHQNHY